jgi:hypothetical protein
MVASLPVNPPAAFNRKASIKKVFNYGIIKRLAHLPSQMIDLYLSFNYSIQFQLRNE